MTSVGKRHQRVRRKLLVKDKPSDTGLIRPSFQAIPLKEKETENQGKHAKPRILRTGSSNE